MCKLDQWAKPCSRLQGKVLKGKNQVTEQHTLSSIQVELCPSNLKQWSLLRRIRGFDQNGL